MNMLGGMVANTPNPYSNGQGQGLGLDGIMKFMGLIQGLQGGMSGNTNQTVGNNGMNADGIHSKNGMGTFNNPMQNLGSNGKGGIDLMKILPLLSMLKGGNPFSTENVSNVLNIQNNNENSNLNGQNQLNDGFKVEEINQHANVQAQKEKQGGYRDKYSTISFAGNEVIYTLGKLWKTRIQ